MQYSSYLVNLKEKDAELKLFVWKLLGTKKVCFSLGFTQPDSHIRLPCRKCKQGDHLTVSFQIEILA